MKSNSNFNCLSEDVTNSGTDYTEPPPSKAGFGESAKKLLNKNVLIPVGTAILGFIAARNKWIKI